MVKEKARHWRKEKEEALEFSGIKSIQQVAEVTDASKTSAGDSGQGYSTITTVEYDFGVKFGTLARY